MPEVKAVQCPKCLSKSLLWYVELHGKCAWCDEPIVLNTEKIEEIPDDARPVQ